MAATLVNEFQHPADVGWYASAYYLPITVLMPMVGKAYSLCRVKWLFLTCVVLLLGKPQTHSCYFWFLLLTRVQLGP